MDIEGLFDADTFTLTYLISDPATHDAVVIDPVLDYDPPSGRLSTRTLDALGGKLSDRGLTLRMILETHAHADHLTGARVLHERTGAPIAIGKHITGVQALFVAKLGLGAAVPTDGRQFDRLLDDGEVVSAGSLTFKVLHTPGHTPACCSFLFGDAVFTGDALFMPDYGTGRCDFPGGSAETLWTSITKKLYVLPDTTRVFVGHDYQPDGRPLRFETTIEESKRSNKQLRADTSCTEFVGFRTNRDAGLKAPRLLWPSIQINVDAGRLPTPDAAGRRFLKIPLSGP